LVDSPAAGAIYPMPLEAINGIIELHRRIARASATPPTIDSE
jgi:hypothetical protein